MALKPCRECGQEVSTEAKTCPSCGVVTPTGDTGKCAGCGAQVLAKAKKCPHCGRDHPTVTTRQFLLGLAAAAAIVVALVVLVQGFDDPVASSPPAINARVTVTATSVRVENLTGVTWTNCRVSLNPGLVSGGYSQTIGRIAGRDVVEGGLLAFTRSGGERFQPGQYAVERVTVSCDQGVGAASFR